MNKSNLEGIRRTSITLPECLGGANINNIKGFTLDHNKTLSIASCCAQQWQPEAYKESVRRM